MLYKQNNGKKLDKKLFEKPTSEYRATPFWAWNCELDEGILGRQIEYMKEMGFGGFHMHSRTGMANEYLGKEFMNLVKYCVNKAEQEEMIAWLYDEDRWPSGFAGGLVTKEIKYRAKRLTFTPNDKNDDAMSLSETLETGKPFFYASFDVELNEKGELVSYRRIERKENAKNKWYAFLEINGNDPWFNNQAYVDTLDKESMQKFIDITYEAYKDAVGDRFGNSVPAIFTDEPQVIRRWYMANALEKQETILPWTHKLFDQFKQIHQYDLIDYLPELIWTLENDKVSKVKYHYNDFIAELFAQSFSDQCGNWCEENNLMLTGHMMEEPHLHSQAYAIGEAMRHYRSFQLPGIDMLCNLIELTTAKQAQSASHQYGREGVLSELYGVTNWDFDFRGHKFQGDWQAALGVTVRVPHLSWVSMAGEAKRDYPASISYQSPWYKEYTYVEDHFARLNTVLTRGKPVVKVAVIHPIESYWLYLGPEDVTSNKRSELENKFQNITSWLLFGQVDFNYICESLLPDLNKEVTVPFKVGNMEYDTIVVPELVTIRRSTFDRLIEFKKQGGNIIFVGECPKYIDAVETDEVKQLYNSCFVTSFEKDSILNALENDKTVEIKRNNVVTDNYLYNMREDNDCSWLFVARGVQITDKENIEVDNIVITVKGEYYPQIFDTISGKVVDASYSVENNCTNVYVTLFAHDSILLRLGKKVNVEVTDVTYLLEEPNVLLLDMAEYALDNEEYNEKEEILRADNNLRKRLGWQLRRTAFPQPWTVEEEEITHKARLRFSINSKINVKKPILAIEDAERVSILFNGVKVKNDIIGYYVDESIKTLELPEINKGINILEVEMPFGKRTNIEWCYILGDFGVEVKGKEVVISEKQETIDYGSIVEQGMPFYGGNVVYKNIIELDNDCTLNIKIPQYRGSLVKVLIDSEEVGRVVYSPYELNIKNVKAGKHEISFILYGNRHNSFGSLHNCNKDCYWFGPDAWRTEGGHWAYEYMLKETGILEKPIISAISN